MNARGATLTEVLVVVVALVLLVLAVVVTLPSLGSGPRKRPPMLNTTQLRGIHQALIVHAHAHGGDNRYYVGLDEAGEPEALDVEARFQVLLEGNYFHPNYLINPMDRDVEVWEGGPVTTLHYSYAMLQVPTSGGRYEEWSETLNSSAVIMADRNTGTIDEPTSVMSDRQHRGWRGGVVWNDNHVGHERTHRHDTRYGHVENKDDHLFQAAGNDDAYLIHSGN